MNADFVHQVLQILENDLRIMLPVLSLDMYDVTTNCLMQPPETLKHTNAVLNTFNVKLYIDFEKMWPNLNLRFMFDKTFSSRFLKKDESIFVPVIQNASQFKSVYNNIKRSVTLKPILQEKNGEKLNRLLTAWGFEEEKTQNLSNQLLALEDLSDDNIWNVFLDFGVSKFDNYRCFLSLFEAKLDETVESNGLSVLSSLNIVDAGEPQPDIQSSGSTVTYVPFNSFISDCTLFQNVVATARAGREYNLLYVYTFLRVLWAFHSLDVLTSTVESALSLEGGTTEEDIVELVPYKTWGLSMWKSVYEIDMIQSDAVSWLFYLTDFASEDANAAVERLGLLLLGNTSSSELVSCWQHLLAWFYVSLPTSKNLAVQTMKQLMFENCGMTIKVICNEATNVKHVIDALDVTQPASVAVPALVENILESACENYKTKEEVISDLSSDLTFFYEKAQHVVSYKDHYIPQQEAMLMDLEKMLLEELKGVSKKSIQAVFTDEFQLQLVAGEKYKLQVLTKLVRLPGLYLDTASSILKKLYVKYGNQFYPYKMLVSLCELDESCLLVKEYNRISLKSVKLADAVAVGAMSSYNLLQHWLQKFLTKLGLSLSFASLAEPVLLRTLEACTFEDESEALDSIFKRVVIANGDAVIDTLQDALVRIGLSLPENVVASMLETLRVEGDAVTAGIRELDLNQNFSSFEEYRQYLLLQQTGFQPYAEEWMKLKVLLPDMVHLNLDDIQSGSLDLELLENTYIQNYPKNREVVDTWLHLLQLVHPNQSQDVEINSYDKALEILGYNKPIFKLFSEMSFHPFHLLLTWHNYLLY